MSDSYLDDGFDNVSSLAMVDARRKKRVSVRLVDKDGDDVSLKDIMDNLTGYLGDQLKQHEGTNATLTEIYPLMAQAMALSLPDAFGGDRYAAALLMSQETLRYAFMHQMTLGFYLLKFIQKNELKIITEEEDMTDEEIESAFRLNKAASVTALAQIAGLSGKEVVQELINRGLVTREDLEKQGLNPDDYKSGDPDDNDSSN